MQKIVSKNFQNHPNTSKFHTFLKNPTVHSVACFFCCWKLDCSEVDLFIGALDETPVTKNHLIASRPYYYDHLTWCIQKAQPIPKWRNIFYLFTDWTVLASLIFVLILLVAVAYILMIVEHKKKNLFEILQIILCCALGLSASYQPQSNPFRILYGFGIFAGIIFATLVSSVLMIIATKTIYRKQIVTTQEILEQDFSLVGDRFALDKIIQQNKVGRHI